MNTANEQTVQFIKESSEYKELEKRFTEIEIQNLEYVTQLQFE